MWMNQVIFNVYFDTNYLYVREMIQYLPYNGFKWLNQREIDGFCLNSTGENCLTGYTLEVDLKTPDELHELHNDYPLALEKLQISHNILSNYCCSIVNKYGIKIDGFNKLVPNLGNKSKYVLYYRNLQLHLSLGMKLVSFHRVLKFKQSDWLKEYTDFNTDKRKILLIFLWNTFLSWWIIVLLVKQWKIWFHRKYLVKMLLLFMKLN